MSRSSLLRVLLCLSLTSFVSCALQDGLRVAGTMAGDRRKLLPIPDAGKTDVSRLHAPHQPERVLKVSSDPAKAEKELRELLAEARTKRTHVSIAGARHSMGGQTLGQDGCLTVDMLGLDYVGQVFEHPGDPQRRWVTVGAGARWKDILPKLSKEGYAPKVMQSNSDFSIGGSLSVNCHGWQHNSEPIASTVDSIRIMTADGVVRRCSRHENSQLFSLALGGYGLFGVILEATLEVIPDQYYMAKQKHAKASDYVSTFESMAGSSANGMAYGRISTAPGSFLSESAVVVLKPTEAPAKSRRSVIPESWMQGVKRGVFRSTVGSGRGKNFRWDMEKRYGETGGQVLKRSVILSEPAALYGNRNPKATEILHEYFVPKTRLADFLDRMKAIHQKMPCPDLLNITVRNVKTDHTARLRYAREEVFGLVMLFHQRRDSPQQEQEMVQYTQAMVDAVLACGGTYYLPYRLHARQDQFERAYPMAKQVFALKRRYDPQGIFQNLFYQRYGQSN